MPLDRSDLRKEAIESLEKAGYEYVGYKIASGTLIKYDIFRKDKELKFELMARSYRKRHKYPIGPRPELFDEVDFYVVYMSKEKYFLKIPSAFLKKIYEGINEPTINPSGQWYCNYLVNTNELQSKKSLSYFLDHDWLVKL